MGKVYVWNSAGQRVLTRETRAEYSGKPLSPFADVRKGKRNRTQRGFIGSPVLADLEQRRQARDRGRRDGPSSSTLGGATARCSTATRCSWSTGRRSPGWTPSRTRSASGPNAGDQLDQGAIVDTPAVANISGAEDSPPEIVVGTNEEYFVEQGNEGPLNAGTINTAAIAVVQQAGRAAATADLGLANANGRVYAVHADGQAHPGGPFVAGWPVKLGLLQAELLPVVGEG
ncbi:MAG: hypothetical protein WKF40_05170 [Thermoleophilaceae bacterium]